MVTVRRGTDVDVAYIAQPQDNHMPVPPLPPLAPSGLQALPMLQAPGNDVASLALAPYAGSMSMPLSSRGLVALPAASSATYSSGHSRVSSSTAMPATPQGAPPSLVSHVSAPFLEDPLGPSLPTTVALATPSFVEGMSLTGGAAVSVPESVPHAVTSLLSVPSGHAAGASALPQQRSAARDTPTSPRGNPALAAAVTAASSAAHRHSKRLCHQQRNLEQAAGELLSGRDMPNDPSNRCGSASPRAGGINRGRSDRENVFVGRKTRTGDSYAGENQRQRRGGVEGEDAGQRGSSHRRPSSDSRHSRLRKEEGQAAAPIYEAEGRSWPSSSVPQEKTLTLPQGTATRTLNNDGKPREGGRVGQSVRGGEIVLVTGAAGIGDPVGVTATGGGTSPNVEGEAEAPFLFTSPAARLRAKYQCRAAIKGSAKADSRRLARNALQGAAEEGDWHGSDRWNGSVSAEDGHADGDAGDTCRVRMVQFRPTGAFENEDKWAQSCHARGSVAYAGEGEGAGSTRSSQVAAESASEEEGTVVLLTIRGMSPLHADVGVVHPLVRVWIVSCASGRSLVEASASVPCAVTHPFDLRAHKTRAPQWNAQVALPLSPEKMRTEAANAMLLLEVVDFGNESIHGFPLLRNGLYPICWGFLLLRDCTGCSSFFAADDLHVQLYRYPSRRPWYLSWLSALLPVSLSAPSAALQPPGSAMARGFSGGDPSAPSAQDVPHIFAVFANANNRKIPYEGSIVLDLRQASNATFVMDTTDMLAYEEYLLSMLVSGGGSSAVPRSSRSVAAADRDESSLARMTKESDLHGAAVPASPWPPVLPTETYYRMDGERSLLPHEVLQTTAVLGAVTCVSFAHSGSFLALGVCRHLQHVVELRDPLRPDVAAIACLIGHTGHIHCVMFQKEDNYLLSCSSDGTVRVWQPRSLGGALTTEAGAVPGSVQCMCTLPHGFPVYTAVFHQERIISGGFSDQLLVWDFEVTIEGEMECTTATENTTLRLTATFTHALETTTQCTEQLRPTRPVVGQLVQRVNVADAAAAWACTAAITLSLASNERSNRVWSVHTKGLVVCWRATSETVNRGGGAGPYLWQMTPRHMAECDGAAEVQVSAAYAIVTCGGAPFVFVFDATTCEQLRVVNTRLPFATPIHLLPDGEAFVAVISDPCRLLAWECFDGGLCTPASGYGKASPPFCVARMAWAESQQLAVFVSRSPCSEAEVTRYKQGPVVPAAGQSAVALHYWQQELQYRQSEMSAEMTLITVAGTARRKSTVIVTTDTHSSDEFGMMFGGDVQPKRKAAHLARRTHAIRQRAAERDTRNARLHQSFASCEPSALLETSAIASIPYDATEKGARMNAIVNFWRGLVSQHRHGEAQVHAAEDASARADASAAHDATSRALHYTEENV
ncbi:hypothetical protein LSCM1_01743 [Leishmania martiniquensis]|uniref:WD domain, G-beta repeat family protein n=1 Tax=Leishmania martiniquensis TaxID=1580590 RepID=A0A836GE77_9TRYP|nr:hypothetical protein LSCM1_01743 [Leishmania martiniquensis]